MTKYNIDEKLEIINQYFNQHQSAKCISKQTGIPPAVVNDWIHKYEQHGLEGIKNKAKTRTYTANEKYQILEYMAEHQLSNRACAAYFNIRYSMVYQWQKRFDENGILGLENKPKGKTLMTKKSNKKPQIQKSDLSELEQLKEENLKLKNTLAETEMELDITKKWVALTKPELTNESWWRP